MAELDRPARESVFEELRVRHAHLISQINNDDREINRLRKRAEKNQAEHDKVSAALRAIGVDVDPPMEF